MHAEHSTTLIGTGISPGIAIGTVYRFNQIDLTILESSTFPVDNIDDELKRFHRAVKHSMSQLQSLKYEHQRQKKHDVASIFDMQLHVLSDPEFHAGVSDRISNARLNLEYVLANRIREIERQFASLENELHRSRLLDLQDVYHRVLRNILDLEYVRFAPLKRVEGSFILVAEKLLPSDIGILDLKKILGIIIETGSTASHVAIISRSLNVPAIMNVPGITTRVRQGVKSIMDGSSGTIILNPDKKEIERYTASMQQQQAQQKRQRHAIKPCHTSDGIRIRLQANAGSQEEVKRAFSLGADEIGLFRSEIYYLSLNRQPSIDEETDYYTRLLESSPEAPCTIRLLDIGGDKRLPFLSIPEEDNPLLGVRGIRFLRRHEELFNAHTTSIIRASRHGSVRLLIPFVSIRQDVLAVNALVKKICDKEGVPRRNILIGIMVETPSVAYDLGEYADLVDFFSIGSNDLTQYLFVANREDESLGEYRKASQRMLVSLCHSLVVQAESANKDISFCGEMASDPGIAALLVGAGLRSLSMQAEAFLPVKKEIESKKISDFDTLFQNYIHDKT